MHMGWRQETRAVIRAYPALKRQRAELQSMSVTANYGEPTELASGEVVNVLMPRSGSASRTTEDAALRQLPPDQQRSLDAVERAISVTLDRYVDGKRRLRLIELLYWKNSHYLSGAADQLYISYATARRWNDAFIELVDAYLKVF